MLEKPDIQDEKIIAWLHQEYGLLAARFAFLPLGADQNTAVYRAVTRDETPYFVKLRRGAFNEISVTLPKLFSERGITAIIPPLKTRNGRLWTDLEAFKVILYPFVEGRNGYEVNLTDRHWIELGAALKRIHTMELSPAFAERIPRERYTPKWRDTIKRVMKGIEQAVYNDPVAIEVAALLKAERDVILDLVARTERHARTLQAHPPQFVLCHSDIHAGNILMDTNGALYIVDWDDPILASKERDLMYAGGGLMGGGRTPQEEETLFYQGYGPTPVDASALAYYRYERIIQDIAIYCEQLLLSDAGGDDREQSLRYLQSNFLPGGVIEIAYKSDPWSFAGL
jgi:spectinomycin phosphotransferase